MASLGRLFSSQFFTGVIGGIVGAGITLAWSTDDYWNKSRKLDVEMVRLSLNILAGDLTEPSMPGRRFALNALEKFSGINIPKDQFELWLSSGTVPAPPISANDLAAIAGQLIGQMRTEAEAQK